MYKIDLSIIIVSYKSKEHLDVLLPSIWKSERVEFPVARTPVSPSGSRGGFMGLPEKVDESIFAKGMSDKSARYKAEIIIVDNDSKDGTVEWLSTTHYPLLTIPNANNGFSHGNNLGIKQANGKYILLLNPDTKLEKDTLQMMLDFMESHQDVGISGCKIIKPDGSLDLAARRRFPNPVNSFKRLFLLNNKDYNYLDKDENEEMEVDSLVGAFMLIRKSVIDKIGVLDETFFMYGEDLDYCWRAKEAGFKVWYYPKTFITHYKGASSEKIAFKSLKWFHQAMWIFYKKHYQEKYPFFVNWLVGLGINLRLYTLICINFFKVNPKVSK
jgi:GT2 family glycosyltransferase